MTHAEKLNQVLFILLDTHRKRLANQAIDERLTFSFICTKVAEVTEDWEIQFLKQRLISDGYVEVDKSLKIIEPPEITQSGIKFIQQGGYVVVEQSNEIDKKIKAASLQKFQYDKWAFAIAILSLIIAILSFFKLQI
ncbi:MAG: hypothetical protein M0Q38_06435 [Bacteroidales bacterium]|jgi:hypothetical protein|nr:hypothetical protein [Bacteroidales bacterium]